MGASLLRHRGGSPDYAGARTYILERLARELAPALVYHDVTHTRDDVIPSVLRLAEAEGVTGEPLLLLCTAAHFHDCGFLVQYADHETASAQVAAHVLPDFGYAPDQIATITALILATRLPQRPQSPLQEILCDADLDVLGREDFLVCNRRLRAEQAQYRFPVSDVQWYQGQLTFLEEHLYVTPAVQALRDAEKRRNILHLQALLAAALDDVSQTGPPRLLQSESV